MSEFFKLERLFWTVIYDMVIIGALASIVLFRVNVLGVDAKFDPVPMSKHDR